ncbi:cytochrome b/b6 domain-containing protein [Sphingomonas tabacisoli]|uniref:Cytochrome b/b6 domain-containing protein n=1 Tax=Sphingomonas tabacisoli TaxID=2249466 RepID=A0ABW4I8S5_9SPHN
MAERRLIAWDLPTRLFHWSLVGLLAFSWWSAENHALEWHLWSGLTVLGLLTFRLLWGLFGSDTARFSHFVKGPRAVVRYLRGAERNPSVGHNPLGGWSVIALLLVLLMQVSTGLVAVDVDGIDSGPLSYLLDFDQSRVAAEIHEWSFNILLGLSALHVAAILFYVAAKRRNLLWPMITGSVPAGDDETGARPAPAWRVLVAAAVASALAYGASTGFRL